MGTLLHGPGVVDAVTRINATSPRVPSEGDWSRSLTLTEDSKVILCSDGDDLYAFVTVGYSDAGVWRLRDGEWTQVIDTVDGAFDPNSATLYNGKIYTGNSTGTVFYAYDIEDETLTTIDVSEQIPASDDINACDVFQDLLFFGTLQSGGSEGRVYSFDGETMTPVVSASGSPSGSQAETAVVYQDELWTAIQYGAAGTDVEIYSLDSDLTPTLRATRSNAYRFNLYAIEGELYATHGGDDHITFHLERWNGTEFEIILGPRGPQDANIRPTGKLGILFWTEGGSVVSWKLGESEPLVDNSPATSGVRPSINIIGDDLYLIGVGKIHKTTLDFGSSWRYTLLHPEGEAEEIFTLDANDPFSCFGFLGSDLYLAVGNSSPGDGIRGLYRYNGETFDFVVGSVHPNWDPQSATEYQGKLYFGSPYGAVVFVYDPETESLTDLETGITEDDIGVGDVFEGLLFWYTLSSFPRGPGSLYSFDGEDFTLVKASDVIPGDPNPAGSQCRCAVVYNGELWTCFATDVPVTDTVFWSFDSELNPTERATLSGSFQVFVHRGELLAGGLAQGVLLRWKDDFVSFTASPGGGAITAVQIANYKNSLYFGSHVSTILRYRENDPSQPSRVDCFDAIGGGTPNRNLRVHDGKLFLLTRDDLRVWRAPLQVGDITQPEPPPSGLTTVDDFDRADENPINQSGKWQRALEPDVNYDGGYWSGAVKVVDNAAMADLTDPEELGYVECSACRTDVDEEHVVVAARISSDPTSYYTPGILARVQSPGTSDAKAYVLYVYGPDGFSLYVLADGDYGDSWSFETPFSLVAGDWFALRVVEDRLAAFISHDGNSWQNCGSTVTDSTITGSGSIGMEFEEAIGSTPYGAIDRFAWSVVDLSPSSDLLPIL